MLEEVFHWACVLRFQNPTPSPGSLSLPPAYRPTLSFCSSVMLAWLPPCSCHDYGITPDTLKKAPSWALSSINCLGHGLSSQHSSNLDTSDILVDNFFLP